MTRKLVIRLLAVGIPVVILIGIRPNIHKQKKEVAIVFPLSDGERPWEAPDSSTIPLSEAGDLIRYGRALITYTSWYLGPQGKVTSVSNGMNCQNCHLAAGTKPWGNNYGGVASTYPKYRDRSGTVESIEKKINDCFERSLNGKSLDSNSREMRALVAYMHWLGASVPKGTKPPGAGISALQYLDRAADPVKGKLVYIDHCQRCHGSGGEGKTDTITGIGYMYPPLWGPHSYTTGAGMYRLSKLAGYVKDNMPLGASHSQSILTETQAWDVAAFINSQPHPFKDIRNDWPNRSTKPVDHPFGPFADPFPEQQHKYGPFGPIQQFKDANTGKP